MKWDQVFFIRISIAAGYSNIKGSGLKEGKIGKVTCKEQVGNIRNKRRFYIKIV